VTLRAHWVDAKSSLGDTNISLGDIHSVPVTFTRRE
jgi:hypothetical protein